MNTPLPDAVLSPLAPLGRAPHIGVFRALMLGDMLCAVPALRAMRAAYPSARITLIGLPWAAELAARLPEVDRFVAFPGFPGLPEIEPDLAALPGFFSAMQAEHFDLLLQLHGSGSLVNNLVAACGARQTAGYAEPGDFCADPALHTRWPQSGHEIDRLLALTDHLGLPRRGTDLAFPLTADDDARLQQIWPAALSGAGYVCVHVGAQLPSRRWAPERFAAVADALAEQGHAVVLTGSAAEAPLVAKTAAAMRQPAVDLCGSTDLWTLGALIARARLLVCNDTGVSHIAAGLGTPSVVVSSGADVARWAPLDRASHPVLWAAAPCRPCSYRDCPHDHGCSTAIDPSAVIAAAQSLLRPAFH